MKFDKHYYLNFKTELKNSCIKREIIINFKQFYFLIKDRSNSYLKLLLLQQQWLNLKKKSFLVLKQKKNFSIFKEKILLLKQKIRVLKQKIKKIEEELFSIEVLLPNIFLPSVTEKDQVLFQFSPKRKCLNKKNKNHFEIAQELNYIETIKTIKFSKTRNLSYVNKGAELYSALKKLLIKNALKHGYIRIISPFIVNKSALYKSGHLPKFKEQLFFLEKKNLVLIPTSEVTLLNLYSSTTFKETELSHKIFSFTSCFRQEAGSYGKRDFGFIRINQFRKLELFIFDLEKKNEENLNELLRVASKILFLLKIPFRYSVQSFKNTSFGSAKTIDIEVYFPSKKRYIEISSCSIMGNFQTRKAKIFYKNLKTKQLLHSLNGTGLALDRLFAVFLEHYYDSLTSKLKIEKEIYSLLFKS